MLPLFKLSIFMPGLALDMTEMAPAMRGDVEVRYTYGQERTQLIEDRTPVGQRTHATHHMDTFLSFNPVKGAGLFIQIPSTPKTTISYGEAYQMGFDPGNDSGSMLSMEELNNSPVLSGKGPEGTWIGLRGSPLHEDLYSSRGDRVSWVLDLGYRFKDKTNFYVEDEDGVRGAGPGASAWLIRGAFSTTHNRTQPYVVASWISSGVLIANIVDDDGEVLSKNVDILPASVVSIRTGAAVQGVTWGEGVNAGRLLADPHLEFGYQSWQDVPSGTGLPDVLDASGSLLATESEFIFLSLGLNLDIRIMEYIEIDLGADAGLRTARQIEHFYPISTSMGTLTWQTSVALRFRGRDPLLEGLSPAGPAF
jgi:hypothetical protein